MDTLLETTSKPFTMPFSESLVSLGNVSASGNSSLVVSSQQETENAEDVPIYMQHMTTILVILHLSVFVSGLVGNSLVCLSVYRNKSLQTVTNYYIVNLAVADFLVILICLPPTVYWDLTLTWNFGLIPCKLVLYLQSISVSVSVLTLTCISIDRWYAICRPLEFSSTKYRAKVTIGLIWLASMIIASPDVVFLTTRPLYEENNYIYMDCTYSWPEHNTKMYQLCIVTLLFIGPFVLMIISYSHIVNVLWRNETMADSLANSIQMEDEQQQLRRMNESAHPKKAAAINGNDDRTITSHHLNQLPGHEASQTHRCSPTLRGETCKKESIKDSADCRQSISLSQNQTSPVGILCVQEKKLLTRQPSSPVIATSNATITIVPIQCQHIVEVCDHQQEDHVSLHQQCSNDCKNDVADCRDERQFPEKLKPGDAPLDFHTNGCITASRGRESSWRQTRYGHSTQAIIIEEDHHTESQQESRYQLMRESDGMPAEYTNRSDQKLSKECQASSEQSALEIGKVMNPQIEKSPRVIIPDQDIRLNTCADSVAKNNSASTKNPDSWNCCKCLLSPQQIFTRQKLNQGGMDEIIVGDSKASKRYLKNMANYAAKRDKYRQWASESFDTSQRISRGPGKLQTGTSLCLDDSSENEQQSRPLCEPANEIKIGASGKRAKCQSIACDEASVTTRFVTTTINVSRTNANCNEQMIGRANGNSSLLSNHQASSQTRFCKLIESRKKAAKMLIVIVIMFGLCYLPIHFLNILRYTIGLPQNDITTIASLVSHWLCYFNSALNPLIYNLMSDMVYHLTS